MWGWNMWGYNVWQRCMDTVCTTSYPVTGTLLPAASNATEPVALTFAAQAAVDKKRRKLRPKHQESTERPSGTRRAVPLPVPRVRRTQRNHHTRDRGAKRGLYGRVMNTSGWNHNNK